MKIQQTKCCCFCIQYKIIDQLGCTATAPANGLVDGAATSSVTNTNTVTFTCNVGYTLSSGSGILTCTAGSLVGTVPTCSSGKLHIIF